MKARWLFEVAVTSLGLLALANCAKPLEGGPTTGEGGEGADWTGPAASSSSSSGNGGAGGSGSSSSGSGGGNASSSSTSASSSGMCESPCKLSPPQCGCTAGQACTLDANNDRLCQEAGSTQPGSECFAPTDCAVNGICLLTSDVNASCYKFCSSDAECAAPGGLCLELAASGTPIVGAAVCTENCDLASNSGCSVSGTACRFGREPDGLMRLFTLCGTAGTTPLGSACTSNDECAAGNLCFGTCEKLCQIGGAACPVGKTCQTFTIGMDAIEPKIGTKTYGVCQ